LRQRTTSFIYSKRQFRATLRAVAQLLPLIARQTKSVMVRFEVCNSEPQHLLAGNVSFQCCCEQLLDFSTM
ncbi:hypothetical protein, partial [Pilibacter termitis]|uniref:hypothetical protein n=1 Tax=Pilibacter termitis TaxID=263852 RepID=UPI00135635C6